MRFNSESTILLRLFSFNPFIVSRHYSINAYAILEFNWYKNDKGFFC
jgi:hypothetical protein